MTEVTKQRIRDFFVKYPNSIVCSREIATELNRGNELVCKCLKELRESGEVNFSVTYRGIGQNKHFVGFLYGAVPEEMSFREYKRLAKHVKGV